MAISTNLISGLSSGFDWRSIIDQLIAIDHRRVDLIADKKTEYESQLAEWKNVNTMLLSLKTASAALNTESAFNVYTSGTTSSSETGTPTAASSLLTVSTNTSVSPALYNIEVNNLAQSEKISSTNYMAIDTALNLNGDIIISGTAVNIVITDTLADVKDKINSVNTGSDPSNVTASIVSYSSTNYHLILTSDDTGEDGLSVLEGAYSGGDNILEEMGFISGSTTIKTATSDGAKSDLFTSSNGVVATLLNLTDAPGSTQVTIGVTNINIDLSTESITDIATTIDGIGGVSASVVSETVNGETQYRIDVSGTTLFTEGGNVLQTLGILKGTYGTTTEVHAGTVVIQDAGGTPLQDTPATALTVLKIGGSPAGVVAGDTITVSGKKPDGTAITTTDLVVNTDITTVANLIAEIESLYTGTGNAVTVTFEGGKITVTADTAGDCQMELSVVSDNKGNGILDFGEISMTTEGRSRQVAAGEDAEIVVDNVTITNSSNTITDVIAGATLNLVGEDSSTTVTLKIERDLAAIKSKIEDMVSAYNSIMDYINIQFTYDEDTEQVGGILFGDGTLSTIKSELINTVTRTITGASGDYNKLAHIGITLDVVDTDEGEYNKLNLVIDDDGADDNDLMDYLETNFDNVRKLFIASGSSPYSNLTYISHTDDTEGGAYNVTISTAATRGTTTGSKDDLVTIAAPETVTLTDFATCRVATVDLTVGMDINDVVNAINSEFALEHTEKLIGANATGQTSSTSFSDVAGANNGDVITFSGTRRSGISVSGSYTISDATTETVGDLLEAIEDMYEDEVTVALDGGKIVITDTQAGDSNLTFNIDTQTAEITGLNFGDVNTTNAGGVVGRYAMNITASDDANKLVLTHNTYGTGQQVSTESDGADALGLNTATKVWGYNVAGTINSLTATGSGQRLSLDSDGNNADGLSISYTGTSTIAETTFTLTLGIGELLDRRLGFITNTSDGYVTYKKTSLGNSIDSFEDRIENMEASLNRKMETMINRFVAMEMALANIQNQSDWLSAQIGASFSGWASL